jgi:Protein of unknown function (DUF3987)
MATITTADPLGRVIAAFDAAPCGDGKWKGLCPVCKHHCLLISKGDKLPVAAWCSRECDKKQVNAAVYKTAGWERVPWNVARFCEMKRLPADWVMSWFGVCDGGYVSKAGKLIPAVGFPYNAALPPALAAASLGGDESKIAELLTYSGGVKWRFEPGGKVPFAWQPYKRPMLYGGNLWPEYVANGVDTSTVVLVEGESDTLTLAYNGIAALGIPGAPYGWDHDSFHALPALVDAKRLLVVHELNKQGQPSDEGRKLVDRVAASFPGKVYRLLLPAKDPSALWLASNTPEDFDAAWQKAVAAAQPVNNAAGLPSEVPAVVVLDEPTLEDDEPLPAFPRLPGALGELVEGITHDIPYDHKALAAITYVGLALSGRVVLSSDPWLQTRFYSCSITTAAGGKSAADVETRRELTAADVLTNVQVELSIDSGPALVQALEETPRLILAPDELADQFEKARAGAAGRNSLFGEFLRLFESNSTANRTKKRKGDGGKVEVKNAHFAILGSATTNRFENMFTGTGAVASGLQSRFVLSYSNEIMPRLKKPNDNQRIQAATAELLRVVAPSSNFMEGEGSGIDVRHIHLTTQAQDAIMEWRPFEDDGDDKMKRVVDHAKRFALLLAVCAGATQVDEETMGLGLKFADYQIALRERLFPKDASSDVQAFENRIIKYLTAHKAASMALISNRVKTEECRGGFSAFNRAWEALLRAGKILAVGVSRKGHKMFALAT